jgi:dephospho-CoA kinase
MLIQCQVSVVEPGRRAYKKIRQEFGDQFFDDDEYGRGGGPLNRERLAEIIFSDREVSMKIYTAINIRHTSG